RPGRRRFGRHAVRQLRLRRHRRTPRECAAGVWSRMMRKALAVAAILSAAVTLRAQNGLIVGSGNFFSPIVSDLDKAIAFYRDGLGLDVMGAPANADDNAPLRNMFGLP